MRITKTYVDRAKYEGINGSRDVRWDSELPGFGVRIYPSGRKSFVFSYRAAGRKRLITVGGVGSLTVQQAKLKAKQSSVQVIEGKDPLELRSAASAGQTMGDLAKMFIQRHAIPHKKSWDEDDRRLNKYVLPHWKSRKAKSISTADVAWLHSRIGEHSHYEANRTIALLSKMFELARKWYMVDATAANPARGIDKFKEKKRDRWVTPEELPALAKAIDEEHNLYAKAAIWLYLFTGLRKSEVLTLEWTFVDFERRELCLPDTKAGRPHYLPLSVPALQLLERLPRQTGNKYVLPGNIPGKNLVNISKPWLRIRKRAKVEDVRLHDLRRTVGSWLAQQGHSLHLIGRVLNHSNSATTEIYARFGQNQLREALDSHGAAILKVIEG
jgi:integrase